MPSRHLNEGPDPASMDAAFFPRTIAVLGATPNAESFAGRLQANLLGAVRDGEVQLVNPRYEAIGGMRCYPSLAALPSGVPDAAMIMTAAERAVPLFAECAAAGVPAVTIFGAGFGEAGGEGVQRIAAIREILAANPGTRLIGPNTIGTANYLSGAVMLGSANVPPSLVPGSLAVISQSGGMALTFLNKAYARRLSIGLLAHVGNGLDLGLADYLRYFAARREISAIAVYLEAITDIRALVSVIGDVVARGKRVLIYRAGRSAAGARMASSHTGVLTSGNAIAEQILTAAGAIVHDSLEALFETAYAATMCRPLGSGGVAIASASGGANVQAADRAEENGVPLAEFSADTAEALRRIYPFASVSNPYDPTGLWRSDPPGLETCMVRMAEDTAVSALVFVVPANHAVYMDDQVCTVINAAARAEKAVIVVYMAAGILTRPHIERFLDAGIPVFESLGDCFGALGRLGAQATAPLRHHSGQQPAPSADFDALLGRQSLDEIDEVVSKQLLGLYGIPTVAERIARTADEAVRHAEAFGGPVAMKMLVPGLTHKTEMDGVRLGLATPDAVREAFAALDRSDGEVVVQPMIARGVELIVGGRRDPLLGPLVVVGLGGVFTELLSDVSCRLAPLAPEEALAMLGELRGRKLMDGYRGAPPADLRAVADIVAKLGWILHCHPAIAEIDINPIIAGPDGAIAVDAAIIRASGPAVEA